eukprot:CAMPEP_0197076138 /NCGR_PEP_ID=MMETSP1384-20130603/211962_1 /TAXON_ID=29189 /ORGANISM="Ammonia sp." /LENGTH=645 /DNA_ID=CAMNT_0042514987 /DNA_START=24 /DNA_END=1961 /DNA_ORIENTATION=+
MLARCHLRSQLSHTHPFWLSSFHHHATASSLTRETRYNPSPHPIATSEILSSSKKRDIIIIGAGHNGLTAASYLSKAGLDVLVLERRDKIGGAAVTEEIFEGFQFSRASYLAGLLRPKIIEELQLKEKYGLEFLVRNPSSFTPTRLDDPLYAGKHLMFWNGADASNTYASIGQFSEKDVSAIDEYEAYLEEIRELLQPFLDNQCPDFSDIDFSSLLSMATSFTMSKKSKMKDNPIWEIFGKVKSQQTIVNFIELMTSPASKILNRYFESDILKTTLATDAVIGSTLSPSDVGSAYVLLHHVMGESEGMKGVWSYAKGGMGAISKALAQCATDHGTQIVCNAEVDEILFETASKRKKKDKDKGGQYKVKGVRMRDGTEIAAEYVLSNCTPYHTFRELFSAQHPFSERFMQDVEHQDYQCGAFKINMVVDKLPNFECVPNEFDENGVAKVGAQHKGTIHFESRMQELEDAAFQSKQGIPAKRPIIEMTIPSSLDESVITNKSLQQKGYHVVQLFVQHAPYDLNAEKCGAADWDAEDGEFKKRFVERNVFAIIDEFAPGFSQSVVQYDALSPRDLEKIFGLYKGNIFHGAISLDQIGWNRPIKDIMGTYRTPLHGLYLCGSGAHPGGGVMGAPGRNCANQIKAELKLK